MRTATWMIAAIIAPALAVPAADVTKVPARDLFLLVPLRIHVLTSKELEQVDAQITDAEAARCVPRINAIWAKAGIHFGLESVVREPAVQVDRYRAMAGLNEGQPDNYAHLAYLLPGPSRVFDGLHVYIVREMTFNSLYLTAADAVIVRERPILNPVEGGSLDPLARVAARGLGMAIGLTARPDDVGLLSSGTNGVGLDEAEIARARKVARTVPGAIAVPAAAREAEAAARIGDIPKARRLWAWLAEIPGAGADEARKRLLALPPSRTP